MDNGCDDLYLASAGGSVCLFSTVSATIGATTTISSAASHAMNATHGVDANAQSVVAIPVKMVPNVSTASKTTPLEAPASTPKGANLCLMFLERNN